MINCFSRQSHLAMLKSCLLPSSSLSLKHAHLLQRNLVYNIKTINGGIKYNSDEEVEKDLIAYQKKKEGQVSIKELLETGKGNRLADFEKVVDCGPNATKEQKIHIQVARYLHRELPIRLAHRIKELSALPIMAECKHIQKVKEWYRLSFIDMMQSVLPHDVQSEEIFSQMINRVYSRHEATMITMAKGAHEIRQILNQNNQDIVDSMDIQLALDHFYRRRIRLRTVIGQYLSLRVNPPSNDVIGLVCPKTSPYEIALKAAADADYICRRVHGDAPKVLFHGRHDLHFCYIPDHLHYMLFELLKNSMRATLEKHGVDKMPPIRIVIADGEDNEDVVIKISDEGGGIKRSNMKKIWSYLFTTASPKVLDELLESQDSSDFNVASPLAGLGYGLPISRAYARDFGGDLIVMSMEGYGTDSYIYLSRIS